MGYPILMKFLQFIKTIVIHLLDHLDLIQNFQVRPHRASRLFFYRKEYQPVNFLQVFCNNHINSLKIVHWCLLTFFSVFLHLRPYVSSGGLLSIYKPTVSIFICLRFLTCLFYIVFWNFFFFLNNSLKK